MAFAAIILIMGFPTVSEAMEQNGLEFQFRFSEDRVNLTVGENASSEFVIFGNVTLDAPIVRSQDVSLFAKSDAIDVDIEPESMIFIESGTKPFMVTFSLPAAGNVTGFAIDGGATIVYDYGVGTRTLNSVDRVDVTVSWTDNGTEGKDDSDGARDRDAGMGKGVLLQGSVLVAVSAVLIVSAVVTVRRRR